MRVGPPSFLPSSFPRVHTPRRASRAPRGLAGRAWVLPLLCTLLSSLFAPQVHAGDSAIALQVTRAGDVKWKDAPCRAQALASDGTVVARVEDVSRALEVTPGVVDVLVSCDSREGVVIASAKVDARRDAKAAFTLAPGFVMASIARDGVDQDGDIVVFDARGHEVARGRTRTVFAVQPGAIRVVGTADGGTRKGRIVRGDARLVVVAQRKSTIVVDASDGEIEAVVTDNGRQVAATVALREPGSATRLVEVAAGEASAVPPGTWDVVAQLDDAHDFREEMKRAVVVTPGRKTRVALAFRTGRIAPTLVPAPGATFSVELFVPGADASFNALDVKEGVVSEAHVSAPKVRVRATRTDLTLDDGSAPVDEQLVTTKPGGVVPVRLNPAVATLEVEARVGGEPRALPVTLWLPGAPAPASSKTADAAGRAHFTVAAGPVRVRAQLDTPHGPLVVDRSVSLAAGANRARLDVEAGTVVVQVMDGGVAVSADVVLTPRLRGGGAGDDAIAARAGEEIVVAPGSYMLLVRRKGREQAFGELKVASGRVVERAVELTRP